MKKISFIHWSWLVPIFAIAGMALESCNPKPKGKVPPIVIQDTLSPLPIIDTTIFEDGIAPVDNLAKKPDKQKKEKVSCGFGFKKFNKNKRPIEQAPGGVKGKKPKPTKPPVVDPPTPPPPDPDPPTTNSGGTIYLDFFGSTISGTMWNVSGSFPVNDAGFSQPEIDYVTTATAAHFTEYNVIVTTDESVFNATPVGRRVRIVITESWEWYGMSGGVAYINSFFWTDNTPAFVFSLLLNYNTHHVAEAAAHEACHTLGLRHQSDCVNGVVVNQYRNGWLMGVSYSVPKGILGTGTSSLSCSIQNDVEKLTGALGLRQMAYRRQEHQLGLRHQSQYKF